MEEREDELNHSSMKALALPNFYYFYHILLALLVAREETNTFIHLHSMHL